ncbi:hypothetical protein OVA13_07130 [Pseudoxanthomonas sp. SL93]|uniref:hypothetical protein n=1 Tax=Pseudoxanthomonas sp. SL93 TaxID=2995142 RepID=UPI002271B26F|nr:hypothetical protein [Pseudoxanthomonas sp. SL93]WAC64522.1 hypothetical protein OVA13_07130 [Pseudoxanthomonas sp. SL93]
MKRVFRLTLAVIAGLFAGSLVNMALVMLSGQVIPPPAGVDTTTTEGLKAAMPLFEPKHFLFPFLAHAVGTLVGAFVATLITPGRTGGPASVIGACFLIGGIAAVAMLPSPLWFTVVDLVFAYLPMAWLGHRLAGRGKRAA